MTPVKLEPVALRSRVKHSTTEPLRTSASTDRQVEREREEGERCSFLISSFFNSENSSTYFKVTCNISLKIILIDEMSLSDCISL